MKSLKIIFSILLIVFISNVSAKDIIINDDKQFELAEKNFANKDYDLAVSEYKKFINLFPDDKRLNEAHYKVMLSYFYGRAFSRSLIEANKFLDKNLEYSSFHFQVYVLIAKNYNALGKFIDLHNSMQSLILLCPTSSEKDLALNILAWFCFENGNWELGKKYLNEISNKEKFEVAKTNKELEFFDKLNLKNPKLAGTLAIIPGLGFLYCERYKDALTAFILNGGLIFAAYKSFQDDNVALGSLLAIVETGFYLGNIYGSISSAEKYNKKQSQTFFKLVKANLNPEKFTLSLGIEF